MANKFARVKIAPRFKKTGLSFSRTILGIFNFNLLFTVNSDINYTGIKVVVKPFQFKGHPNFYFTIT